VNVGNTRRVTLAVSLLVAFCEPQVGAGGAAAPTTVIADVTLISPERPAPLTHAYVRIANGRIADVSTHPLKGDVTVDGRGKFLIPGLIDSHMHLGSVPGMQAPQRAAHPDLVAQAVAQEPRSYLYFGFTTVLSLGDTAEPIHRWNALDVRPDAYFCGGTPIVNGYAFTSVAANPYFLFNPDQASALPAAVDRAAHAPGAVVERMARDGAICVKSYRETGFGRDAGRLPVPSVETIRAVVAAAHARNLPVFLHANSRPAQAFAVQAGGDVIAHGMWNGQRSTADALDTGVGRSQAVLGRKWGISRRRRVIRGLGAELDDTFHADLLLAHACAGLGRLVSLAGGGWFRRRTRRRRRPLRSSWRIWNAVTRYLAQHDATLLFGTDTPAAASTRTRLASTAFMRCAAGRGGRHTQQVVSGGDDQERTHHATGSRHRHHRKGKRAHLLLLRASPLKASRPTHDRGSVSRRPVDHERLYLRFADQRANFGHERFGIALDEC
jgi:hypothetical protein